MWHNEDMETDLQSESSRADHLKPWQFKPGVSGNPGGKKKGTVSLKTYAKNYIQGLSDEEKEEFMKGLDKKVIWEMAEGKPKQDTESHVTVELPKPLLNVQRDNSNNQDSQPTEKN